MNIERVIDEFLLDWIFNPIRYTYDRICQTPPIWLVDAWLLISAPFIFAVLQSYGTGDPGWVTMLGALLWPLMGWALALISRDRDIKNMQKSPNPNRLRYVYRVRYALFLVFLTLVIYLPILGFDIAGIALHCLCLCAIYIVPDYIAATDAPPPPQEDTVPHMV